MVRLSEEGSVPSNVLQGKGMKRIEDPEFSYFWQQGDMLKRNEKVFGSGKQCPVHDMSSQDIAKGSSCKA